MPPYDILGGAAIGGGFGVLDNLISQAFAEINAKRAYKYNEMAAEMADKRTRALYNDLYSPQALMNQYDTAGLSKSLLAGKYGGAGAGQTGAQGAGAGGAGNAPYTQIDPLTAAQIANINADTKLKEEEAGAYNGENKLGSANISKILADTGNTKASEQYTKALTYEQEIKNIYAEDIADINFRHLNNLYEISNYDKAKAFAEMNITQSEMRVKQATIEERIRRESLLNDKLIKDMDLEDAQITQIKETLLQGYLDIMLKGADILNRSQLYKSLQNFYNQSAERIKELIPYEKAEKVLNMVYGFIDKAIDITAIVMSGGTAAPIVKGFQ